MAMTEEEVEKRTLKLITAVTLAIALAGCATPDDVRKDGTRHEYLRSSAPDRVAGCMQRNAERSAGVVTSVRSGPAPDSLEVLIRTEPLGLVPGSTVAVAELRPYNKGVMAAWTEVQVWIAWGQTDDPNALALGLLRGC